MSKSSRPTLKTIAELTGLAVPTVSRALSGAQDIGLNTRERVRKVADEIGYVPNRAGVRLRTGQTHVIALIFSSEADVMNMTARLINSAASVLRKTSYQMIVMPFFPDEDIMRPIQHVVETQAADAIIINQIQENDPRVKYLIEKKFPFATHGRSKWAENHSYYDFDNETYGELAVRGLAERGRKSLCLLAPPVSQNYATNMIVGASREAKALNIDLEVIKGLNSDDSSERVENGIAELLARKPGIDGIICASANSCMASVCGLEKSGYTVGKDIDLFSKEAMPFLNIFRPAILSVYEDAWTAGDFLMKAAIERIEKADNAPMQFLEVPS